MTFAEANARYELVKQRFLAGDLNDSQFDEQLRDLMVMDEAGRWWAKSRENGAWHYYDAATEAWVTAVPPLEDISALPGVAPERLVSSAQDESAQEPAAAPEPAARSEPPARSEPAARPEQSNQGPLPKWAAVAPTQAGQSQPARSGQQARPAAGYSAYDFAPLPELGTGLKIVYYVLSFLVPLLGLVLFAVYRKKPAPPDRAAARIFLILGVISVVLYGLCGVMLLVSEAMLLGAGT